jgi:hypothetical protein
MMTVTLQDVLTILGATVVAMLAPIGLLSLIEDYRDRRERKLQRKFDNLESNLRQELNELRKELFEKINVVRDRIKPY